MHFDKYIIMRNIFSFVILMMTLLVSCSGKKDNIVIYKEFQDNEWPRFEFLNGTYNNTEIQEYDIVMEVVVTDIYPSPYENHQKYGDLSFNMNIKYPNDSGSRSKDYTFKLKDKDGNWKSDKKNGCYTFLLPITNEITFNEIGTYKFKIENKYSKDPLSGIKSLKIKCIDSKK